MPRSTLNRCVRPCWYRCFVALITALLLSVTACTTVHGGRDRSGGKAETAASPVAPVLQNQACPSTPRVPATGTGDQLMASVSMHHGGGGWDLAMSQETVARMPEVLATGDFATTNIDAQRAMKMGAFALGGSVASLSLENAGALPVTVYDIRPVNIVTECLPLALAVQYGNEGGGPEGLWFDLDAAAPVAHGIPDAAPGEVYFETKGPIELAAGAQQELVLRLDTIWGAYSYELALDYQVRGVRYRRIVDDNGIPFRTTTGFCPTKWQRARLDDAEAARLRAYRFGSVRRRTSKDGQWWVSSVTPQDYAQQCQMW